MTTKRSTPPSKREPIKLPPAEPPGRLLAVGATIRGVPGESAFITLQTSKGVPRVFEVPGDVKCVICDGFSRGQVVCVECTAAVKLIRSANFTDKLSRLLASEHLELVLDLASRITEEALTEYLVRALHADD